MAALGAAARILFRRPWTVEARADDRTTLRWRVTGWRASHDRSVQVSQRLQDGSDPDQPTGP